MRPEPPGTMQGRVLLSLRYQQGTVSDVARRLRADVLEVLVAVIALEREGEIERAPLRRGRERVLRCSTALVPVSAEEAALAEVLG